MPKGAHPSQRAATPRVLIIDDDLAMANAIRRVLRRMGCETAIAHDGHLAGALFRTFRPSLVTLDLSMPRMGGLDVLDFLQGLRPPQQPQAFKILVVSAASPFRIAQALSLGAHGAVMKPFVNETLVHEVDRLLMAC